MMLIYKEKYVIFSFKFTNNFQTVIQSKYLSFILHHLSIGQPFKSSVELQRSVKLNQITIKLNKQYDTFIICPKTIYQNLPKKIIF